METLDIQQGPKKNGKYGVGMLDILGSFNAYQVVEYPKYPTALNATSKRVRVPARVNDHPVLDLAIDYC